VSALVEQRADFDDDNSAVMAPESEVVRADDDAAGSAEESSGPLEPSPISGPVASPVSGSTPVPVDLRIDFGAHFEANYQRLVAQLYAMTLDAGLAHDAVQDAYSRAWHRWSVVGSSADPAAWVRGVAVRSVVRSWRTVLTRFGIGRPPAEHRNIEPRTAAMLSALRRLSAPDRRAIVLTYMSGSSIDEIAAVERVSYNTVQARLSRGRRLITEYLADDLSALLGDPLPAAGPDDGELR
jgi:RNA polymerase sigma factor (sigma-70 family)